VTVANSTGLSDLRGGHLICAALEVRVRWYNAATVYSRPGLVWRSLALRLALAVIPAWFTAEILIFNTGWRLKTLIGFILGLSIVSPVAGLVVSAALAPLGQLLAVTVSVEHFRVGEAIVLAFFVGWLLHGLRDRRGPSAPGAIGWLLAATVVASVAGLALRYPGQVSSTFDLLVHEYNLVEDRIGLVAGARLLEGLALAAGTIVLFRQRPRLAITLPAVLAMTGCLAAAASFLLWRGIAPAPILRQYAFNRYRVSAHVFDSNAAGSYFGMLICLTLGMSVRARGRNRAMWLAATVANTIGLWFTASRSSMGSTASVLIFAAIWLASSRLKPSWRTAIIAGGLAGAALIGSIQAGRVPSYPLTQAADFRFQFNAASLRMIAARPMFGVGVGQYYDTSPLFLTPRLAWTYGSENAHNYFLQVGAELGVLGLGLYAAWLFTGLIRGGRALSAAPRDVRLLGIGAGVVAFLGTCLTGHPFLIFEVAAPFWVQFGLLLALAGSTLENHRAAHAPETPPNRRPQWVLAAGTAAIGVCVVLSAPMRALQRDIASPQSRALDGFYGWETGADGTRYRWTGQFASVFVPADVTRVYVPVRIPAKVATLSPIEVDTSIGGIIRARTKVGDTWADINLEMPDALPPTRFTRVNLRVERTWQPALYIPGSSDLRMVGVQVGECRLFKER
jgi:O-antigen ligase